MTSEIQNISNRNFWPDTWVVWWGEVGSSPIDIDQVHLERSQHNKQIQIDQGRSWPRPEIAEDKYGLVVFDGQLYNQAEIETWIGVEIPGQSVALTLLKAYQVAAERLFSRLKGSFVLLLWEFSSQTLLAARDPVGIYPLFYANGHDGCYFSISIDALIKQQGISKDLDRAVIADYLALRWPFKDETFYQDIKRVPPGNFLQFKNQDSFLIHYWNPVAPDGKVDWINEDVEEQFECVMNQAINDLTVAGPTGIYLSGGLDSVTTAALATDRARQTGQPPPLGLSLIFPSAKFPEEPVQRGVAKSLGIPLYITTLAEAAMPKGLIPSALDMSEVWSMPMMNLWRPAYHHLGKIALENGCKIILTGAGGDEWLGLTPYYAADLIRGFDLPGLSRLVRGYHSTYNNPVHRVIWKTLWTFGLRELLSGIYARKLTQVAPGFLLQQRKRKNLKSNPGWLAREEDLHTILADRMQLRIEQATQDDLTESFYLREIKNSLDHSLVSLELEEEFESGRRLGIPVKGFFQHQDLINFLFYLDPVLLNTGRPGKGLVRSLLERRFPDLGFGNQKKVGATGTFRSLIENDSIRAWQELGGAIALEKLHIVNSTAINQFILETTKTKKTGAHSFSKWNILNIEKWVRAHDKGY